jgi:hypothetical protein
MNDPELLKGIRGKRLGPAPASELDHFYTCETCGQSVDRRELWQVFHHEEPGHGPHPVNA